MGKNVHSDYGFQYRHISGRDVLGYSLMAYALLALGVFCVSLLVVTMIPQPEIDHCNGAVASSDSYIVLCEDSTIIMKKGVAVDDNL